MTNTNHNYYSMVPRVGLKDYPLLGHTSWEQLDAIASQNLGYNCVSLPSVRVGICWTLEFNGYSRHKDHILVPKFVGRCILNAFNRYSLPVEDLTPETRLAIVVHQFGLTPDIESIRLKCAENDMGYLEDSPYGLNDTETLGPDSIAKFIGLSKVLPVLKGAVAICRDTALSEFLKNKRQASSIWSWPVLAAMSVVRYKNKTGSYSALAEAAYEMYVNCEGDNRILRGNLRNALENIGQYADENQRRISLISKTLKGQIILPNASRVGHVVPFFPGSETIKAQEIFHRFGFSPNTYNIDVARNLFNPKYELSLLIPLNPKIPYMQFSNLVESLGGLNTESNTTTCGKPVVPIKS